MPLNCSTRGRSPRLIWHEESSPDVTIVAVGPSIVPPQIPGSNRRDVITGKDLREMMNGRDISGKLAWWMRMGLPLVKPVLQRMKPSLAAAVTRRWMPVGKRVVVIGGDLVAIELAEFLVERGRKVTVVSTLRSMAPEMAIGRRWRVLRSLREHFAAVLSDDNIVFNPYAASAGKIYSRFDGHNISGNQLRCALHGNPQRIMDMNS